MATNTGADTDSNSTINADLPRGRTLLGTLVLWYVFVLIASVGLLALQSLASIPLDFISIVQFAPTIGVLGIVLLSLMSRRTRSLAQAVRPRRIDGKTLSRQWWLALVAMAIYSGLLFGLAWWASAVRTDLPFASVGLFVLFLVLQLIGATGEEIGWRGFAQPALETRIPRWAACIVIGFVWAIWHVQNMVDPLTAAMFILSCIGLSLLFGYLTIGSLWQRALLAGFMHGIVNIAQFLIIDPRHEWLGFAPVALALLIPWGVVIIVRRRTREVSKET